MHLRCYFSCFIINVICLSLISCATQHKASDKPYDLVMKIGNSAVANGSYNIAIPVYRKACQIAPSKSQPYVALGKCYLAKGDKEQARMAFVRALQRSRHDIVALRGLAKTDLLLNNLQWSATYIQEILKKQHTDAETLNMLGVLLDLNEEHGRAQSCYLTGLRWVNFDAKSTLYNDYAVSLALSGNYDKALSILTKAESTTNNPKVLHNIKLIKNVRDKIMTAKSKKRKEALRQHLVNELMPQKNYSKAGKTFAMRLSREYCQ